MVSGNRRSVYNGLALLCAQLWQKLVQALDKSGFVQVFFAHLFLQDGQIYPRQFYILQIAQRLRIEAKSAFPPIPWHTQDRQPFFGWKCAVETVNRVAGDMTMLILAVDPPDGIVRRLSVSKPYP
jgi:hypothetical protein